MKLKAVEGYCSYLKQFAIVIQGWECSAAGTSQTYVDQHVQAIIQQGVGHCCGSTFLSKLSPYGFWNSVENVEFFIKSLRQPIAEDSERQPGWQPRDEFGTSRCSWAVRSFYVHLSSQTARYDQGIRKHPNAKLVHTFKNYASSRYGNDVDLYFVEI